MKCKELINYFKVYFNILILCKFVSSILITIQFYICFIEINFTSFILKNGFPYKVCLVSYSLVAKNFILLKSTYLFFKHIQYSSYKLIKKA